MKEINKSIGERLRKRREDLKLTQEQVSELLGISLSFYGSIERGQKGLPLNKLHLVNSTMEMDLNYLITGTNTIPDALQPVFVHFPKHLSQDKLYALDQIIRGLAELVKK